MSDRKRILVFGAGNIGRSFVAQLFARAGWSVTFSDVDPELVTALRERGAYDVVVKREGRPDETIRVEGVDAVDGRDQAAAAASAASADCLASCVGKAALPRILPVLARALLGREAAAGGASVPPLDLILAENDRGAPASVRAGLAALLPAGFPLARRLGIVETSIGKMVPIMRAADLAGDRLRVFAEEYNELIVDARAFLGGTPAVAGLKSVDRIEAWVDRKLFVHNLGHAAVAYMGSLARPGAVLIRDALAAAGVEAAARRAMGEAADALAAEYPLSYTRAELDGHIDDLVARFDNSALGDTVYRVGRDLRRKLDRDDRIVGAALLCERRGLPWDGVAAVFAAALSFRAADEAGSPFPADLELRGRLAAGGLERVLREVCRLERDDPLDARVAAGLTAAWAGGRPGRGPR